MSSFLLLMRHWKIGHFLIFKIIFLSAFFNQWVQESGVFFSLDTGIRSWKLNYSNNKNFYSNLKLRAFKLGYQEEERITGCLVCLWQVLKIMWNFFLFFHLTFLPNAKTSNWNQLYNGKQLQLSLKRIFSM